MNDRVPDLAMVPRLSISSWRSMPMPLSRTVRVSGAFFGTIRMVGSPPCCISSGREIDS